RGIAIGACGAIGGAGDNSVEPVPRRRPAEIAAGAGPGAVGGVGVMQTSGREGGGEQGAGELSLPRLTRSDYVNGRHFIPPSTTSTTAWAGIGNVPPIGGMQAAAVFHYCGLVFRDPVFARLVNFATVL